MPEETARELLEHKLREMTSDSPVPLGGDFTAIWAEQLYQKVYTEAVEYHRQNRMVTSVKLPTPEVCEVLNGSALKKVRDAYAAHAEEALQFRRQKLASFFTGPETLGLSDNLALQIADKIIMMNPPEEIPPPCS